MRHGSNDVPRGQLAPLELLKSAPPFSPSVSILFANHLHHGCNAGIGASCRLQSTALSVLHTLRTPTKSMQRSNFRLKMLIELSHAYNLGLDHKTQDYTHFMPMNSMLITTNSSLHPMQSFIPLPNLTNLEKRTSTTHFRKQHLEIPKGQTRCASSNDGNLE